MNAYIEISKYILCLLNINLEGKVADLRENTR